MTARDQVGALRHASVYVATVTVFAGVFLLTPASILWTRQLGASPFIIGIISAGHAVMMFTGNLMWGGLADKYGRKPPIIIGSTMVALALLLFPLARDPWDLFFLQLFRGFFGGAASPVMAALAADLAPRTVRGGRMGVYALMISVSTTVSAPLSGVLFDIAPHWPFITAAAMQVLTVLIVVFVVPETLIKTPKFKPEEASNVRNPSTKGRSIPEPERGRNVWVDLSLRRGLILANFWIFMVLFGLKAVRSIAVPLFALDIGLSATSIGTIYGIAGIVRTIGYIPFGVLSDRIGRKWPLAVSMGLQGLALTFYPIHPSFWGFATAHSTVGVGASLGGGPSRALVMDWTTRSERGKALGLNRSWENLGKALGDPLAGWIIETYGFTFSFYYGATIMLAASIVMVLAWQPPPRIDEKRVEARVSK